jgi:hypothetical protein
MSGVFSPITLLMMSFGIASIIAPAIVAAASESGPRRVARLARLVYTGEHLILHKREPVILVSAARLSPFTK